MTKSQKLIERLQMVAELIDLDNFYSIGLSPNNNQLSLQGRFTDTAARFAKSIDIVLEYQNDNLMLKGETSGGGIRLVLT